VRLLVGLPALLFLLYAPGAATLNALGRARPAAHLFSGRDEWLFAAVLVSVLATGGLGLVLAEVGWFSWWTVLLAVAALCLGIALAASAPLRPQSLLDLMAVPAAYPQRAVDRRLSRFHRLALLLVLVVAALLFSRPAEMLRGALDSGVYVNAGVALGNSGSIFQRDVLMRQLNDDAGEGRELLIAQNTTRYTLDRLRMFGFYVYDKQAALVVPQHYSLYPVWIGLLYSLFGIWGALYATPLLALLAAAAVYFFARRALSAGAALLALALLVVCPVTIWFARYPVSEVITCLLAFGAFYAFMRMVQLSQDREALLAAEGDSEDASRDIARAESARRTWASLWGVVAAVSLGQIALARPDFVFYLAPVPLFLAYWRLSRTWTRPYTWFAAALAGMLGLYAVHFFFYSYPYTLDLYHNKLIDYRRLWRPLLLALYLGVILLVAADRLYPRLRPLWVRSASWAARYRWAWAGALAALVAVYAIYQYAIGPWLPNVRFDRADRPIAQAIFTTWESYIGAPVDQGSRYNLLRVGWYLSPLGMALGIAGLVRWIWGRLGAATGLFFGSLLVVGFVFIEETYTDPHYIYTMRRYVPVILPALIMGIAWACQWAWSRLRPLPLGAGIAGLLAVGLAVFYLYTGRAIIPHVEERGAVAQLTDLAGRFPGRSVVLFSNERDEPYVVATPLQYIFGIESFALARPYPQVDNAVLDRVVARWQRQGYTVWAVLGANGGKLSLASFDLKEEGSWKYDVPEFEQLRFQKPTNVSRATLPWGIYSLVPRAASPQPGLPFRLDVGDMDYKWLVAGFYLQERAAGDPSDWRWTGNHAILRVPWPSAPGGTTLDGGKITLRLRPESPSQQGGPYRKDPLTVKLMLEDTPIGEIRVPPGSPFADYTLQVPAGATRTSPGDGTALLHIQAPTWSPQRAGLSYDARALGVQVDVVEVSR
jgi:hypothetical protein